MSHQFIPGEILIFIGETLGPYTTLKKGERVEFIQYFQSGGMHVSRYTQSKNVSYIPRQDVCYFIRDWKVRDRKINDILEHGK